MAVFDSLTNKFSEIIKNLRSKGRVTESDINLITREIKLTLLEADVNYKVVKDFVKIIKEKSLDSDILKSLTPGQQIIKIVNEQLIELLGGENKDIAISSKLPSKYILCGLQGAGKTTTCAKLATIIRKKNKKVLLCALDVYRPAAILQLISLGKQIDIEVFYDDNTKDVIDIAKKAIKHAEKFSFDAIIFDTAGRLHIDETLMDELKNLEKLIKPDEILLTVDAMTGQDAVNVAKSFNDLLEITGVILTKLDGDTRGGAALSVKSITGKTIKFVTIGEKMNDIEVFYPKRMASRILGMGDVLSLIEKAQENVDFEKAKELEKRLLSSKFTLNDFLDQIEQMKNMGSMESIMGMLPGVNKKALSNANFDEKQIDRTKAIIQSMNKKERNNPKILDASRRKRIAKGSGTTVQAVNKLLKDFNNMKLMMKQFTNKKGRKNKSFNGMKLPF